MYNLHIATKIKKQLKKQRLHHMKQHQYIQRYTEQVQPKLLDNYNKRINTFMRKMEENPIILTKFDQSQYSPHKLFRNFQNKQKILGSQYFKFKDHNDWSSIYTEAQRSQRLMNQKVMKQKFGDASLAYRSIISQSQYEPSSKHEYRFRQKQKQINPPMKYVFSIPKIMIRKINNKKITQKIRTQGGENDSKLKRRQTKQSDHERSKNNKSGVSKVSHLFDEDNKSVRSFKSIKSFAQSITTKKSHQHNSDNQQQYQNEEQRMQKQKKKFMSPKMHFKTLIQTFEQSTDKKTKQSMREVLVKCGIFRHKDKKAMPQVEIDKLSFELQSNNAVASQSNSQNNNNPEKLSIKLQKIKQNSDDNKLSSGHSLKK